MLYHIVTYALLHAIHYYIFRFNFWLKKLRSYSVWSILVGMGNKTVTKDQLQPSWSIECDRRGWYQTNDSTHNKLVTVVLSATKENNRKYKRGRPNLGVPEEAFLEKWCSKSLWASLMPGWSQVACTRLCKMTLTECVSFQFST